MGFQPVKPIPGMRGERVLISCRIQRGRPTARIRITIHTSVLRELGWTAGIDIQPLCGDGPDAGMIKLRTVPKGGFKLRNMSNGTRLAIEFGGPHGCPAKHASCEPEFFIGAIDKSLTIRLPWHQKIARAA